MTSIRRRTLTLILGLLFVGLLIITVFNLHDSNHEIAEVYDAQLAQNARLLQGVMRMPMASKEHAQLYQAFNSALASAVPKVDGHPYESKIAFQVWDSKGAHRQCTDIHLTADCSWFQRRDRPKGPYVAGVRTG